ncbi:MAG TPA: hypothetical protein VIK13_01865 [Candidatus Limnocylindrales bacterium]
MAVPRVPLDVLDLGEEIELSEVGDRVATHAWLDHEIKAVEGLERGEAGGLHAGAPAVAVPPHDLLGENGGRVGRMIPALVEGVLGSRIVKSRPTVFRLMPSRRAMAALAVPC